MDMLPEGLRVVLETDFDSHVLTLLGLLTENHIDGQGAEKKSKIDVPVSVADDSLRKALVTGSKRNVMARLVASRVPSDEDGMKALVKGEDALQKAVDYVRICSSLGGRCSSTDDRVASFAPFATYMKTLVNDDLFEFDGETGLGALLQILQSAIGSIHAMILRGDQDQITSLASWSTGKESMASYLRAAQTCHDIVSALVGLRTRMYKVVDEDCIQSIVSSIRHTVRLISPYAPVGLLASHAKEAKDSASIEDLIQVLASTKEGLSCGREELKAPIYILYMNVASHAISLAHEKDFVSLAASLESEISNTMPPVSIQQWLTSQPPSAIIQVLLDTSSQGLKAMSGYIVHSMKQKELQALSSLSYSELTDGYHAGDQEAEPVMDDLLFYESTAGELNMLPRQWDDDDDDDE